MATRPVSLNRCVLVTELKISHNTIQKNDIDILIWKDLIEDKKTCRDNKSKESQDKMKTNMKKLNKSTPHIQI